MRIFKDAIEAVKEIERDLFEMGTKITTISMQDKIGKFDTIELRTYCYTISNINRNDQDVISYLKLNGEYIVVESLERVSGKKLNPGDSWLIRKKEWEPYLKDDKFAYTYSERIASQIEDLIDVLIFDNSSRQGIITIYEGSKDNDNRCGVNRIPCSMYYQLMIRDNKLHMIYTMRSCDFLRHFGYDLIIAMNMQRFIAKKLKYPTGDFTHFIGSLHAYKKDLDERGIF